MRKKPKYLCVIIVSLSVLVSCISAKDTRETASTDESNLIKEWLTKPSRSDFKLTRLQWVDKKGTYNAVFSPDGTRLITNQVETGFTIYDAQNKTKIDSTDSPASTELMAISPKGNKILSSDYSITAQLWELGTGDLLHELGPGDLRHELDAHEEATFHAPSHEEISLVAFIDEETAVTGAVDIRIWDCTKGWQRTRYGLPSDENPFAVKQIEDSLHAATITPSPSTMFGRPTIRIRNLDEGKVVSSVEGPLYSDFISGAFLPGNRIALAYVRMEFTRWMMPPIDRNIFRIQNWKTGDVQLEVELDIWPEGMSIDAQRNRVVFASSSPGGCYVGALPDAEAETKSSDNRSKNEHRDTDNPLKGQNWTIPEIGMNFVYVEPGVFRMGWRGEKAPNDCQPVHEVEISNGFWIGKYELTQAEYKEFTGSNPEYIFKGKDKPVPRISWNEAAQFCNKLTERERRAGRLPEGYVYRLPTEAEWEYAARGGKKGGDHKYSGSNSLDKVGWYKENSKLELHKVGRKDPNQLGIYDMSGNVREWCLDWLAEDYYRDTPRRDPVNTTTGGMRVCRGGNFQDVAQGCRVADRSGWKSEFGSVTFAMGFGLRVLLAPAVKTEQTVRYGQNKSFTIRSDQEEGTSKLVLQASDGKVAWGDLLQGLARMKGFDDAALRGLLPEGELELDNWKTSMMLQGLDRALGDAIGLKVQRYSEKPAALEVTLDRIALLETKRRFKKRFRDVASDAWKLLSNDQQQRSFGLKMHADWKESDKQKPVVIFVHGLHVTEDESVGWLASLRKDGFPTGRFVYPNDSPIKNSGSKLADELADFCRAHTDREVALVTFSMGGLVARWAVEQADHSPENVSRLIMVAPPNHGSDLARFAFALEVYRYVQDLQHTNAVRALMRTIEDGLGEASNDLIPGSPFLDKLNSSPGASDVDYSIILGTGGPITRPQLTSLRKAIKNTGGSNRFLRFFGPKLDGWLEECDELIRGLGDGAVTVESGRLKTVDDVVTLPFDHATALKRAGGYDDETEQKLRHAIRERLK